MERLNRSTQGFFSGDLLRTNKSLPRFYVRASFRLSTLAMGVGMALSMQAMAAPDQSGDAAKGSPVEFNTAFIQGTDEPADLKEFLRGNSVLPGVYRVDVYVNRVLSGRNDVRFTQNTASGLIEPCLTLEMLRAFGLDMERLHNDASLAVDLQPSACFDLAAQVEFARVDYQPNSLRLNVSVPQTAMARSARGYVSPELWTEGETAAFINYSFNGARRHNQQERTDQYYLIGRAHV